MNGNHTADNFRLSTWRNLDNLSVPEGTSGSKDREFHDLKRFLSFHLGLQLPLVIEHRDRPDFRIDEQSIGRSLGIEHTRAANPAYEEAKAHLHHLEGAPINHLGIARNWFEENNLAKPKGKHLPGFIKDKAHQSPIWAAPDQGRAKAAEVLAAISGKAEKGRSDGFDKFAINWLVIADASPFWFLDFKSFQEAMAQQWPLHYPSFFDDMFFLTVAKKLPYSQPNGDSLMRVGNGRIESVPPSCYSD